MWVDRDFQKMNHQEKDCRGSRPDQVVLQIALQKGQVLLPLVEDGRWPVWEGHCLTVCDWEVESCCD